ncbi:MAG: guanylate kinase [archaeon]|jgi:guanylate kinase
MNKIIIISGPSGAGKGTIKKYLLNEFDSLKELVTTTTRAKRKEDVAGKTYNFVSKEKFESWIKKDELIEYDFHFGNYYGSRISDVEKILKNKKNILIEVDVKGAMTFKEKFSDAKMIFIKPPTINELKKRIIARDKPTKEDLNQRITRVKEEYKFVKKFDFVVINNDLTIAKNETKKIVKNIVGN